FAGINLLKQSETAQPGGLEHRERNSLVMTRNMDGTDDLLRRCIEYLLFFFAFHGIVQNGTYLLRMEGPDRRLAVFNGFPSAEMVENCFTDDVFHRHAGT